MNEAIIAPESISPRRPIVGRYLRAHLHICNLNRRGVASYFPVWPCQKKVLRFVCLSPRLFYWFIFFKWKIGNVVKANHRVYIAKFLFNLIRWRFDENDKNERNNFFKKKNSWGPKAAANQWFIGGSIDNAARQISPAALYIFTFASGLKCFVFIFNFWEKKIQMNRTNRVHRPSQLCHT